MALIQLLLPLALVSFLQGMPLNPGNSSEICRFFELKLQGQSAIDCDAATAEDLPKILEMLLAQSDDREVRLPKLLYQGFSLNSPRRGDPETQKYPDFTQFKQPGFSAKRLAVFPIFKRAPVLETSAKRFVSVDPESPTIVRFQDSILNQLPKHRLTDLVKERLDTQAVSGSLVYKEALKKWFEIRMQKYLAGY